MKNLSFFVILFLLSAGFCQAQVNSDILEGEWKIEALDYSGIYYDFTTGLVVLDESVTGGEKPSKEELEMMSQQMKEQTAPFTSNLLGFNKGNFKIVYGGQQKEGTYVLKIKENRKYIEATYPGGSIKEIDYELKDQRLHLVFTEAGNSISMIFKHV